MPGIAGIIAKGSATDRQRAVVDMTKCLVHEPFYTSGTCSNDALSVTVGWAGQKGTFSDCLPIWNERRDICLIFSGEDFPYPSTISDLRAKGHQFNDHNAGYLVHLYEEFGSAFLNRINGWFSGLMIDSRERRCVLFNDRYGMNRIYFHESDQGFYFSSEAKSLLKVLPHLRRLDSRGLGEFISCGCVLQNRSLFSGVSLMPGGSAWTFAPGQSAVKAAYFHPQIWEQQPLLDPARYYERLNEIWMGILPRYLSGPQRVGISLTGGVDSRMILACAPGKPDCLPCYTFGGMYRDCADVTISRQVAKLCGQPHDTIPLTRQFFSEFPVLAEKVAYVTDGSLDPTGTADLVVNRIARRSTPVRVTGLNGGELLRSLVMFKPNEHLDSRFLAPELKIQLQAAELTYNDELQGNRQTFIAFKQAPWYLYARLALERSQITIRTPYFDNDLVALSFQAPPEMRGIDPALRLIAAGKPTMQGLGTDRASRLRAIPGVAFARHQWQEFTFKAEYAFDYGMPQWLAKADHLFAPLHFEKLFLGRHKFYHFRLWYRDELSRYVRDMLLDSLARGRSYLNGPALERLVLAHTKGRANHTTEIHKLLTLELLQRQMIDQG